MDDLYVSGSSVHIEMESEDMVVLIAQEYPSKKFRLSVFLGEDGSVVCESKLSVNQLKVLQKRIGILLEE